MVNHANYQTNKAEERITAAEIAKKWQSKMLRFAILHLQPKEEAEDAVQDALLAFIKAPLEDISPDNIQGYLFGILKHKITDKLRKKYQKEINYQEAFEDELDNMLFDQNEHWNNSVVINAWHSIENQPENKLQNQQLFTIIDNCISLLPEKPAKIFSMKEFLDCDADEICEIMQITKADYWKCISRARKQLQICISKKWF